MKTTTRIKQLTLALVAFGLTFGATPANADHKPKVIVIEKGRPGPIGHTRGILRPAADDLRRATDRLVEAARENYRLRGRYHDSAIQALDQLNESAQDFYRDADDEHVNQLRGEMDTLRRDYERAEDYFVQFGRDSYVRNEITRTQIAMRTLQRQFYQLVNARPVNRPMPVPGRGVYGLVREIEAAATDMENYAGAMVRDGETRGDYRRVRLVMDRLNEVSDRAGDLRRAMERRDNIQHNLSELKIAYDRAEQRYDVFGNRLNSRYARLGDLIDRFDDQIDEYRPVTYRW